MSPSGEGRFVFLTRIMKVVLPSRAKGGQVCQQPPLGAWGILKLRVRQLGSMGHCPSPPRGLRRRESHCVGEAQAGAALRAGVLSF